MAEIPQQMIRNRVGPIFHDAPSIARSPNHVSDTRNLKIGERQSSEQLYDERRTSRRIDESNEQLDDEQQASRHSMTILDKQAPSRKISMR